MNNPIQEQAITVEEYARRANDGESISFDRHGRIRTVSRAVEQAIKNGEPQPGISLRKRRAWY